MIQNSKFEIKNSPSLSIIVPTRNEEKYIQHIVRRVLAAGLLCKYELIFVEGHSKDKTLDEIKKAVEEYQDKMDVKYIIQKGIGKADAVWNGFETAKNDILVVLDADLTVAPEDLSKFYRIAAADSDILVNGTRMILPMEKEAMKPLNYLGNKLFALLLSVVIGKKLTDTLCGTRAICRTHFHRIRDLGLINKLDDPFCDFTLLLGASKLGLKIIEVPVEYKRRIYDTTKIRRFRDGWRLLKIMFKYLFL